MATEDEASDTVDLAAHLSAQAAVLRNILGEHITVDVALGHQASSARVDPSQLEEAIFNLAFNARDAMTEGGRLLIETANVELSALQTGGLADVKPGSYVMVTVSDTGVGMPPEVADKVLEPSLTTEATDRGTGFRLSMVYGFVNQANGHMEIYSQEGQGTSVRLYLPSASANGLTTSSSESGIKNPKEKKYIILVVEDDQFVRNTSVNLLNDIGYTVIDAENGHDALNILSQGHKIDLIFTDIMMPGGLSGLDLAKKVRTDWPEIGVLLTSGYFDARTRSGGWNDLDVPLLKKPYRRKQLENAIVKALRPNHTKTDGDT